MIERLRAHLPQFLTYLAAGFTAAGSELASYKILLLLQVYYVTAAVLSGFVGLLVAFLLHKYVVFKKKERMMNHAVRYILLQSWNLVAQAVIVYVIVDVGGTFPTVQAAFDPVALVGGIMSLKVFAKVMGIGATVTWNFFLYKYMVYV